MRNAKMFVTIGGVVFLSLAASAAAAPLEIVGALRDVDGVPLAGTITVIQETPRVTFTSHEVDKTGLFKIAADSAGALVLHAAAAGHPGDERVIPAGAGGVVSVDFVLPLGRDVQVRVIDAEGRGVPGAALRVRYHEPGKPPRRVAFDTEELTDGDGRLLLRDVGIEVPFVVDVLASNYPPISSDRTRLTAGKTELGDIVLGKPGATVVVELVDKDDAPVRDALVTLLADPAGLTAEARGSWLHHQAFRQRAVTSALGNVRFTGVPPGRIIVRAETHSEAIEQRAVSVSNQELRMTLRALQ